MIPKLPIYAKGDSMGIAVYPTGVSLETTYTVKASGYKKTLTNRLLILTDTKIMDFYG